MPKSPQCHPERSAAEPKILTLSRPVPLGSEASNGRSRFNVRRNLFPWLRVLTLTMPKKFSSHEVDEILRRAAQLQSQRQIGQDKREGWSLHQVQRLGTEAGLDPHLVAKAAMESRGQTGKFYLLGAPHELCVQRTIQGELSEKDWQGIVLELRETFCRRGNAMVSAVRREWASGNSLGPVNLSVTRTEGGTQLKLLADYSGGFGLTAVAAAAIASFSSILLFETSFDLLPLFWPIGLFGFIYGIRASVGMWWRRRRSFLQKLLERIEENLSSKTLGKNNVEPGQDCWQEEEREYAAAPVA
jgi:hypothetical protein